MAARKACGAPPHRRTAAPPINYKLQGYKNSAQTFSGKKAEKSFFDAYGGGLGRPN